MNIFLGLVLLELVLRRACFDLCLECAFVEGGGVNEDRRILQRELLLLLAILREGDARNRVGNVADIYFGVVWRVDLIVIVGCRRVLTWA